MRNVYTVTQVNEYIRNLFAKDYMLERMYIKGEVSNCKYHTSGHIYFSLKDESGTISCVMFAGQRGGLSFRMSEGQQVIVLGKVSTYPRSGTYQVYANEIILDGAGVLYEKFNQLKNELEEMGMFAPQYKRSIPTFAHTIGIVTASTGAAIQDIIHIAKRRNPYTQLVLYPAQVQGDGAAKSIVKGIRVMEEKVKPDVIIVGRGGGSIEDLWAFNEREVAEAIFQCAIPIISAVGHETDTTIADYVADLRAPTPSAAAEVATFEYNTYRNTLKQWQEKLEKQMLQKIERNRTILRQQQVKLKYLHPGNQLQEKRKYLTDLEVTMERLMAKKVEEKKYRLGIILAKLKGLSPLTKLELGYAYLTNKAGETVKSIEQVKPEETIKLYVTDGTIEGKVITTKKENYDGR